MKYKLIATDMDGTLLNSSAEVSKRTKQAVQKALDAGVLFVIATGRALPGMGMIADLHNEDMPLIILNGASVVMARSRKVLFKKYLDISLAKEAYELGLSRNIPMAIWTDARLWISWECDRTNHYVRTYGVDLNIISDVDMLKDEGIYKVLWFGDQDSVIRYQNEMHEYFGKRLNSHSSWPTFLEFVSPDADKGAAMAEIGRIYGIEKREMIAVGDSYNDISMLKYAGLGVAMENAPDEIKAICNHVTLTNDNDGVAAVIDKFILQ